MTSDFTQKFLFEDLPIRGSFVRLSESWREVLSRSRPDHTAREMLGQALSAAALLISNTKFNGTIGLQIQTSGALRLLHVQCSREGQVRGIARTNGALTAERLGDAVLAIHLEPAGAGTPYQGLVSMDPQGLVPALETYFRQSEQLDTRFWLMADKASCHGMMLQRVPGDFADPDDWVRAVHLAGTVSAEEFSTLSCMQLVRRLFHDDAIRLFAPSGLSFGCRCSTQRVADVLHALGKVEILGLIEERGGVEVCCEYCGQDYYFDRVDAAGLFSEIACGAGESPGIH